MNLIINSEALMSGLCSVGTKVNDKECDSNMPNGQAPINDMCHEHNDTTQTCNPNSSTTADAKRRNCSSMTNAASTVDANTTEQCNRYCSSSYGVLQGQMNDIRYFLIKLVNELSNNYCSKRTDEPPIIDIGDKKDELPSDIISQAEAAKMLCVTERTIRNYVARGLIRRKCMGKKPFYSKKEIIEFLNREK